MYYITNMTSEKTKQPQKTKHDGKFSNSITGFDQLSDLVPLFNTCVEGEKTGAGFVRGRLTGVREDKYLAESSIVIIDADYGKGGKKKGKAPSTAKDTHAALSALGYDHIIYTSASHTPEHNKYRALILTAKPMVKSQLAPTITMLSQELKAKGIDIDFGMEHKKWTQHWHFPRSLNPEVFEYYDFFDGLSIVPEEASEEAESDQGDATFSTLDEMYTNIRTGKEYHESMLNISYQLIKDGMSSAHVKSILRMLMESVTKSLQGDNRWVDRYQDIDRVVDGAVSRATIEIDGYVPNMEQTDTNGAPDFPFPYDTGRLSRTIKGALDGMPRKSEVIAFVQTMSMYSTAIGASWNFKGNRMSALNLAFIIVAESGVGKASIGDLADYVFRSGMHGKLQEATALAMDSASYIGKGIYSGPVPLHGELFYNRNRLLIAKEMAQSMKEKAGSPNAFAGYYLNTFIDASNDKYTSLSGRTETKDEMITSVIPGCNINFVGESNPFDMALALKGYTSLRSGFLNRHTVFKISGKLPINDNILGDDNKQHHLDADIEDGIVRLMKDSWYVRDGSKPVEKFRTITLDRECFLESLKIDDDLPESFPDSEIQRVMSRRAVHKMYKFASIKAIVDYWDGKSDDLVIPRECWVWAKKAVMYEIENTDYHLDFIEQTDTFSELDNFIFVCIGRAYNHKDTTDKQRKANVVKFNAILDRGNKKLLKLASHPFKSPDQFILERLKAHETMGNLEVKDNHTSLRGKAKCIIMTPEGVEKMKKP